jgi:phosphate acetyltransferase
MTKNIFIASAEPYSGKSLISLGIVNMLLGKAHKVGYFKPIINPDPAISKDVHIETVVDYFNLPINYEDTYAFTRQKAMELLEMDKPGEIIDTIIRKVKSLEEQYDFTIIEGSDFLGAGAAFEFESNVNIAKNLGAPVILAISGDNKTTPQVINSALTVWRNFDAREVQVLAVIVNRAKPEEAEDIHEFLSVQLPKGIILAVIPEDIGLQSPTMKEIYEQLGGQLVWGKEQLSNRVDNFITGAMQVPQFLNHIKENVVIVTPADRGDIVISALQANLSANYPKVAGIVLTGGGQLDPPIMRLIEGLQTTFPIVSVNHGTFRTTTMVGSVRSQITPDNTTKIQLAISTFNKYVDVNALDERIITYTAEGMTPHMFQYQLTKWAKTQRRHIVLPEGNDDRILIAASRLIDQEIVDLTILGDLTQINASIKRLGLNFDKGHVRIINPAESEYYQ